LDIVGIVEAASFLDRYGRIPEHLTDKEKVELILE